MFSMRFKNNATGLPQFSQNSDAPKGEAPLPAHSLPSSSLAISFPQPSHVEIVIGQSKICRYTIPAAYRCPL
jgi:hypothetical protein